MSRAEGTWGEAEVANYLRRRGYTLLAHGFHCRFGEIDLIARKDGVLCFVEVKTRTNLSCGLPREYVTPQKQHNEETKKMSSAKSPIISGFFATQTAIFLCTKTQM